jgi:hypothetical protein
VRKNGALGVLVAVTLSVAACAKPVSQSPSTQHHLYTDALTPSRALAIAPIGLVGVAGAETTNALQPGQRFFDVRVVRTLFDVSKYPIRPHIVVIGGPSTTMPAGSTHVLSLYPLTRKGEVLYELDAPFAANGSIEKAGIQYHGPDGNVYALPMTAANAVSCFVVSPERPCRSALLATIGIESEAQRTTYDAFLHRDFSGGYWWLRARDHHRPPFPTRVCVSGTLPRPCASSLTFMLISGIFPRI